MALLAHLLGIATVFLGPLLVFLIMKSQSKFVAFHALQAVLFQCLVAAGYAVSFLFFSQKHYVFIGVIVISAAMGFVSALAANRGEWFEIPVIGSVARGMKK